MKKFLLLLSCFLATWCSVQAELKCSTSGSESYGMSQSSSMLLASTPAAAPAPTMYPAVINSATYKPEEEVVEMKFTVNTAGKVAFSLDGGKTMAWSQNCTRGSHTANIPFKAVAAGVYSIVISVNGAICGGTGVRVEPIDAVVNLNKISYIPKNKTVKVEYSIYNPKSEDCYVKVRKNSSTGSLIFSQKVLSSSTKLEIPSTKFKKDVVYYVEVSCGDNAKSGKKYIFDDVRSGYMGKVSVDDYNVKFNYNLKNASEPYIAIKKGSKDGPIVTKFGINNTNDVNEDVSFYYGSVLKGGTTYVADLFDGTEDLRIFSEGFTIPKKETISSDFTIGWYYNQGTKKMEVWANGDSRWPGTVSIWIYKNNRGNLSIHDFRSGSMNQRFEIGIEWANPQNYTIIIEVAGVRKDLTVCVGENVR